MAENPAAELSIPSSGSGDDASLALAPPENLPLAPSVCALAFSVPSKLRNVKEALKSWNKNIFGDISLQVADCKERLASIQVRLQTDMHNTILAETEKDLTVELSTLLSREESFLKQKSRIKWLDLGDSNSAYFHRSVKANVNANFITQLSSTDGSLATTVKDIKDLAVHHFKGIFNAPMMDYVPLQRPAEQVYPY
ncbi:uncharacterized protein LOC122655477 [Telopea speciosissima]|uniref:uncharacterized protein LOC122655477 n=1 Tax=Telopea speciosissima TaxID=54955 RepID=UPI001CC6EB47|nr:uncharacterized protein LOC122655477 [Telopea speciosissima]